jgi:peptidoglycan/xylan/chitin deacetylase (PgdA/CDA1 family)
MLEKNSYPERAPFLQNRKVVCLSLDLEQDYGEQLDNPQFHGIERLGEFVNNFKKFNLPITCFVQGSLFETHPKQIEKLTALDIEFELHSYSHPRLSQMNFEYEIKKGKEAFYSYFGYFPSGYRSPLAYFNDSSCYEILSNHGFKYDSSICPTYRPGVFLNFNKPLEPYYIKQAGIVEIPMGVFSKIIRVPAGLSYLRLFDKNIINLIRFPPVQRFLVFHFHLHDLFQLSSWNNIDFTQYPFFIRQIFKRTYIEKPNGIQNLDSFISFCHKNDYKFEKMSTICQGIKPSDVKRDKPPY